MTQETDDNGKLPEHVNAPVVKKGSCMPNIPLPEEVADDLRSYIFELIDTKKWAGRSIREIAGDIINADEKGTDKPRFYTVDNNNNRKRLNLETTRRLLNTYRHRSLDVFKDDLMPYLQEAIVEVIKTAGKKPSNLKLILEGLQLGNKEQENDNTGKDTPSPTYAKVREQIGLDGDAAKRTRPITQGLRALGHEDTVRDDTGERGRSAAGVVSGRSDPGMDGPPNIIEVDGGPFAFAAFPSQDDILHYGGEYLGDAEEPEHSDTDELSSPEADEEGDGKD